MDYCIPQRKEREIEMKKRYLSSIRKSSIIVIIFILIIGSLPVNAHDLKTSDAFYSPKLYSNSEMTSIDISDSHEDVGSDNSSSINSIFIPVCLPPDGSIIYSGGMSYWCNVGSGYYLAYNSNNDIIAASLSNGIYFGWNFVKQGEIDSVSYYSIHSAYDYNRCVHVNNTVNQYANHREYDIKLDTIPTS